MNRVQLFKYSLLKAGMMPGKFARMLGVSPQSIYYAINGGGSPRINEAINIFINEQIPKLKEDLYNFNPLP